MTKPDSPVPGGGGAHRHPETPDANWLRTNWADWREALWRGRRELRPKPIYRFHVDHVLADTQLSPQAKVCYWHLFAHADDNGEVIQSVAQIAAGIGLQNRQTQDVLKELISRELVRKIQYHPHKAAHYYLVPVPSPVPVQET